MSGVKVRDRDKGAKALIKRMASARTQKRVSVGVREEEAQRTGEDEVTNLDVAGFAEFGERPWLTPWEEEHKADNRLRLRKIGEWIVAGKIPNVEVGLEQFGLYARMSIQSRIRAGIPPPNEPSTIARKGSSTPLIDSGQFFGSITHWVDK